MTWSLRNEQKKNKEADQGASLEPFHRVSFLAGTVLIELSYIKFKS
jgi:hypothetical protein